MYSHFYRSIDGWRGIAALLVVVFHIGVPLGAELASVGVMMFFVISGYCIAASADRRHFDGRRGFFDFYKKRVLRIYPSYLASLAFFVITRIVKYASTGNWQLTSDPVYWLQNVTLTQWLHLLGAPSHSPVINETLFVAAYWSLCYEEQFYIVIGLLMLAGGLTSRKTVAAFAALTALSVVWVIAVAPLFYGVFLDLWLCFAFGVLCYIRLCRTNSTRVVFAIEGFLVFCVLISGVVLASPESFNLKIAPGVVQYIFVSAVFACALIALRSLDEVVMDSMVGRSLRWLGLISYSLYLTHEFNLNLSRTVATRLAPLGAAQIDGVLIQVAVLCAIAAAFWYIFERPFARGGMSLRFALADTTAPFRFRYRRVQPPL
jgi:peptidoglycan/LPS O-acetylase OafA/YrhL